MEGGVMKDAIVFVCRGFTSEKDMQEFIYPLEKTIVNNFTNIPCYRAFLDDEVRRTVFMKDGSFVDNIESCLNLLISKKVKNVNIVPLVPCYGQWYTKIEDGTKKFQDKFTKISISKPILNKTLNTYEMMILEKGLANNEDANKKLVESVSEIIKRRKR